MNHPTVETRWLWRGGIPSQMQAWLQQVAPLAERQPRRQDDYLAATGTDLGIKMRDNRLEIKQLTKRFGERPLGPDVFGVVEAWSKWSYLLAIADRETPSDFSPASIPVAKTRQMQKFRVSADREVTAVSMSTLIDRGCELELSHIETIGQSWWSLALEAFGEAADLTVVLQQTARHVFIAPPPFPLTAASSHSYPAWLAELENS